MSTFTPRIEEFWLNIISEGDSGGVTSSKSRNVAIHDIPFSRRNLLQDTGSGTKEYNLTVVFQDGLTIAPGQDLENRILPTFASRLPFLQLLDSGNSLIFQHPEEGILDVRVSEVTENTTSMPNYMSIDITLLREVDEISARDVTYIIEENAASFRQSTVLNESKITQISRTINDLQFKSQLAQFSNELNSFFSDIDSLPNSIINTINYVEGTVGDLLLTINQSVDRMIQAQRALTTGPATFINNMITQIRAMSTSLLDAALQPTFESTFVLILGTSRIAFDLAEAYIEDDKNQEKAEKNVGIETFDNKGNFLGTPEVITVMTINELESTLETYRQLADDVIQLDRDNREIQTAAALLQTYIDAQKLDREKIITVEVNNVGIFDLLNRFNLSYQLADRIKALNPQIRNPNFMTGSIRLVVPSA